jgi:hypothetical protein
MRNWSGTVLTTLMCLLGAAGISATHDAHGQTVRGSATIALKSGETSEVGPLYYVVNCKSLLKSTPEAEILEGPPAVSVAVKEAMVLPRAQNCANRIAGGILVISAKDVEDPSYTPITVRITYKTKDGDRKLSQVFNLSLIP